MGYVKEGKIRRRPNPQHIPSGERKSYLPFADRIPPGTVVWKDGTKTNYGTTEGGACIYVNPNLPHVSITNINGDPDAWGMWIAEDVILKQL